jgi:hypothetical protein
MASTAGAPSCGGAIEWKIAAASVVGSVVAVGLWSIWLVPDKAAALPLLGICPSSCGRSRRRAAKTLVPAS